MFQVVCNGGYPGKKSICSGVAFGRAGTPLNFAVQAEGVSIPLKVKFNVLDDPSKPSVYYELNPIIDGEIDIDFFNVTPNGASSCGDPLSIVSSRSVDLQMIFHVDRIQAAPNFRLTYEFFEVAL